MEDLGGRTQNFSWKASLGDVVAAGRRGAERAGERAALPADPPATICRDVSCSKLTLEADIFVTRETSDQVARASSSEGCR